MIRPTERSMRMKELIGEERDFDVLIRSLAKKLLKEQTVELPSSVLAGICGVSEAEWNRIFSRRRNYLNDLISLPVREAGEELEQLDGEERNFVDKLEQILRIIYWVNTSYPEVMVLFTNLAHDPEQDEKLGITVAMDSLRTQAFNLLKRQAYEEDFIEADSPMESLLFFLIRQMLVGFQTDLFHLCESYVECRNPSVFPEEDDLVNQYLNPVKEQLKGFTAV